MRLVVLAVLVPFAAWGGELPAADRAEIRRVISAQIEAFRHDDAAGAFALAAPGIRSRFGDAAHFLAAVRQAYAPLYHPRSVVFADLTNEDGLTEQSVDVIAQNGLPAEAIYDLQHQPDGRWLISSCRLLKAASEQARDSTTKSPLLLFFRKEGLA